MSSKFNATPEKASRAYDKNRDGFVISGGGGILILEEYEHAKARGAKIYAELVGYGATADGADMVAPSGEGAVRCMRMAIEKVKAPIDYINPHATSTPVGDIPEINAIREVFGANMPPISATKSLTGHSQGAAGVHEAIYTLLMMQSGFICESANIEEIDPAVAAANIVRKRIDNARIETALSNSFGFGRHQCPRWCSAYVNFALASERRIELASGRSDPVSAVPDRNRPTHGARVKMADGKLMQGKRGLVMGGRQRPFHRLGPSRACSPPRARRSPSPIRARPRPSG